MPWSLTPSSVGRTTASVLIRSPAIWLQPRGLTESDAQSTHFWYEQTMGNSPLTWGWTSPWVTSTTTHPSSPEPHTPLTSLRTQHQVACCSLLHRHIALLTLVIVTSHWIGWLLRSNLYSFVFCVFFISCGLYMNISCNYIVCFASPRIYCGSHIG